MVDDVKENKYAYLIYDGIKVSKNEAAKGIMGYRNEGHPGACWIFAPAELGYACPICGLASLDRLEWSEYAAFIWCPDCNLDMPSCLCVKGTALEPGPKRLAKRRKAILKATEVFLETVEEVIKRSRKTKRKKKEAA